MDVYFNKEKQTQNLDFSGTVADLLSHLSINPETVIVSVGDTIVGEEHELSSQDKVTVFSVLSGG